MKDVKNAIVIKDLSYAYSDGINALRDVSFEIATGERIALVGANGAGKSTLLSHLNGIIELKKGSIEIMGTPLERRNLRKIRKKVGIVFQDPEDQLFMAKVFDDVAFGPINMGFGKQEVRNRVRTALKKVGLAGYEERCPHHLSFGEKKRIGVATVLSMRPDILLLDEPTSNLDPCAKRNTIEMLKKLPGTMIIASHDIEMLLELCNRAVVLDRGEIAAMGDVGNVLTDVGLLRKHGMDAPLIIRMFGEKALEMIRKRDTS